MFQDGVESESEVRFGDDLGYSDYESKEFGFNL